ncbi:MAG: putative Ig domain-containing protein [Opitutae bacterium]|nr:putative Ig domain-containing protein [Opitutae bacterium]
MVFISLSVALHAANDFATLYAFSTPGRAAVGRLVQGGDGALYGVLSADGGSSGGLGLVYKVNRDGTGFTILKQFTGENGDGALPYSGLTLGADGLLYGTTRHGGDMSASQDPAYSLGRGIIFRMNLDGSGYTILKKFAGSPNEGALPVGKLLQGSDGALYGTTETGGRLQGGTVFKINRDGTGFAVLRSLDYSSEGSQPWSGVIEGGDGVLYGTTISGSSGYAGTVFKLNRDGTGFAILKSFSDQIGTRASGELCLGSDGVLYGTCQLGGPSGFSQGTIVQGRGTVFKINRDGTDFAVLKNFTGQDGAHYPQGGLTLARDGYFYGTTAGSAPTPGGNTSGTIFKISADGSVFNVVKVFTGSDGDGNTPDTGLTPANDGLLYGTTKYGGNPASGSPNCGVVYVLTPGPAFTPTPSSRLINLSVRSGAGTGNDTLIVGFVLADANGKQLLMRGVGPTLASYGVTGALTDPVLSLWSGDTTLTTNDDWGSAQNSAQISALADQLKTFGLPNGSRDSALLPSLSSGVYTARVEGKAGATGLTLVEVYDASSGGTARLINISARTKVGTDDQILVSGFVIAGAESRQVLIRGIGPTLANYGVGGVLADPHLALYWQATSTLVMQNDNWSMGSNAALIAQTAEKIGALPLITGTKDAALLATLPPGAYSAQVSGVGGTTGVALVEVYEASYDTSGDPRVTIGANSGTGQGSVTIFPSLAAYPVGAVITITATPASGSIFAGWVGDASGTTNPLQYTVSKNTTISASFAPNTPNTYVLAMNKSGTGSGTISANPAGPTYTEGTVVTLTATAASGSTFAGWSGDGTGSTTRQVTMDGNKSVTATFNIIPTTTYTLTTTTAGTGSGTVSANPAGPTYAEGTVVTLTATAASGSTFAGWSGDGTGSTTRLVTMDGNKSVTATFNIIPATTYTLTTTTAGTGSGTVSANPAGPTYTAGTVVTLTATASSGSTFAGWSGAASGTAATAQVTMTGNISVTATFTANTTGNGASSTLRVYPGQTISGSYDPYKGNSVVNGGTLFADGGQPFGGYTWSISSLSALPAGVSLAPNGILSHSGGAVLAGSYTFNVTVSDGVRTATGNITCTISTESTAPVNGIPGVQGVAAFSQLLVPSFALVGGRTGWNYGSSVFATVGTGTVVTSPLPLSWSMAAGSSLPPGLTLDAARGVIYGVPTTAGTYTFKVVVKSTSGEVAIGSPTYSIKIDP